MAFDLKNLGGKVTDLGSITKWSNSVAGHFDNPAVKKALGGLGNLAGQAKKGLGVLGRITTSLSDPNVLRFNLYLEYVLQQKSWNKNDPDLPAYKNKLEAAKQDSIAVAQSGMYQDQQPFKDSLEKTLLHSMDIVLKGRDSNELDAYSAKLKSAIPGCKTRIPIKDIKAFINKYGVSVNNKFRVDIRVPGLTNNWVCLDDGSNTDRYSSLPNKITRVSSDISVGDTVKALNYAVESVTFPGVTLDTRSVNYGGFTTALPIGYNVDQCNIVFNCFGNMDQKAVIDNWLHTVYNFEHGGVRFYDDYAGHIKVYQLNNYQEETYGVLLRRAYPVAVQAIDYSNSSSDVTRMSVTFQFEKVIPISYAKDVE